MWCPTRSRRPRPHRQQPFFDFLEPLKPSSFQALEAPVRARNPLRKRANSLRARQPCTKPICHICVTGPHAPIQRRLAAAAPGLDPGRHLLIPPCAPSSNPSDPQPSSTILPGGGMGQGAGACLRTKNLSHLNAERPTPEDLSATAMSLHQGTCGSMLSQCRQRCGRPPRRPTPPDQRPKTTRFFVSPLPPSSPSPEYKNPTFADPSERGVSK